MIINLVDSQEWTIKSPDDMSVFKVSWPQWVRGGKLLRWCKESSSIVWWTGSLCNTIIRWCVLGWHSIRDCYQFSTRSISLEGMFDVALLSFIPSSWHGDNRGYYFRISVRYAREDICYMIKNSFLRGNRVVVANNSNVQRADWPVGFWSCVTTGDYCGLQLP